jgi:hypothetical protein
VPWCPTCARYLSPSTVRADGTCPTCGNAVDPGRAQIATGEKSTADDQRVPLPWHLKLLAAAAAVYLAFRAWQGIEWIIDRF